MHTCISMFHILLLLGIGEIKSSEQWESKFTIFSLITIRKNSNHTGLDKSLYKPYNLQTLDKTEWIRVHTYWLKNGYLNVCMFS